MPRPAENKMVDGREVRKLSSRKTNSILNTSRVAMQSVTHRRKKGVFLLGSSESYTRIWKTLMENQLVKVTEN
jgi:hypothetical protein